MLFFQDILEFVYFDHLGSKVLNFSDSLLTTATQSMSLTNSTLFASCESSEFDDCRDEAASFPLKFIAIASILISGIFGVAIPLVGKHCRFLKTDGSFFVATKAFAAGVILATGFVHMLSGATDALSDPCLPEFPWKKFPFAGFFAMVAALVTLLVDFLGTQYYERKQGLARSNEEQGRIVEAADNQDADSGIVPVVERKDRNGKVFGEEEDGAIHIVGMHAHAAHHRHSHVHDGCEGRIVPGKDHHGHGHSHQHGHSHGHSHGFGSDDDVESGARHVVVSQRHLVLCVISQIIEIQLLADINLKKTPQLVELVDDSKNVEELMSLLHKRSY